jgi:hypothetical protein
MSQQLTHIMQGLCTQASNSRTQAASACDDGRLRLERVWRANVLVPSCRVMSGLHRAPSEEPFGQNGGFPPFSQLAHLIVYHRYAFAEKYVLYIHQQ